MALYHYTSRKNMEEIRQTGIIMASHHYEGPHGRNAMLGEGVYLTDLPPHTPREQIVESSYGQSADRVFSEDPHVCEAYIKIPRKYVPSAHFEVMPGGRKVYVIPTDYGINLEKIPCDYGFLKQDG